MNLAAQNPISRPLMEIPDPPERFGEDGGKFYRCYDALAEELDDDMTKGLKEQLDGVLIFAGLFAGVNTAFLALTIPLLSPDAADDTNSLLAQNNAILLQLAKGRNDSLPADSTLPSTAFSPSGDIFMINTLFSLSLAFTVISSFLAVLGRQWLIYYRKQGGGGPNRQRWEQLKRSLGAERWRLKPILDDVLPSLLQTGLIVFCASFILYLRHLHPTLALIVGIPISIGLAFFVGTALCTLWDRFCPFHSPLSHSLSLIGHQLSKLHRDIRHAMWVHRVRRIIKASQSPERKICSGLAMIRTLVGLLWSEAIAGIRSQAKDHKRRIKLLIISLVDLLRNGRQDESVEFLQAIAVQRTICISDDPATLLYATANILAIESSAAVQALWATDGFQERFRDLGSLLQGIRGSGDDYSDLVALFKRIYSSALVHKTFITNLDDLSITPTGAHCIADAFPRPPVPIPDFLVLHSPSSLIRPNILSSVISERLSHRTSQTIPNYIVACSEVFATRSDLRFCGVLSSAIIILFQKLRQFDLESFGRAYRGELEDVSSALNIALDMMLKPELQSRIDCDRVIVNILKGIRRMSVNLDDPFNSKDVEPTLKLLEICEHTVRDPRSSDVVRPEGRGMRVAVAQQWGPENVRRGFGVSYEFSQACGLFLTAYFRNISLWEHTETTQGENIDVAQLFFPMIHYYLRVPRTSSESWAPLRITYNAFALDTYRRSREQEKARRVRDPDERWCYHPEERISITTVYPSPDQPLLSLSMQSG